MIPLDLFHILIAFGAFQAIFLSVILLGQKNNRTPKRLFSLFLIIEGITLVERLLAETELIVHLPHLLGVSYPINFIKPPILLFMVLYIVKPKFRLKKSHLLNVIPFVLILLMNVPFYFQTAAYKLDFVAAFINYVPSYQSFNFWFFLSFYLYIGSYLVAGIRLMRTYTKEIKNNKLVGWLLKVFYLYSGSLFIGFFYFIVRPSGLIEIPIINTLSMLSMTFLIQSVAYSFLSNATIFTPKTSRLLDLEQSKKDAEKIKNKLESDKAFLNSSLKLREFASSVELPEKYVSDLINQKFGCSFSQLVNRYRVDEAKELMKKDLHGKPSILAIAEETGFNNKVSFYRAFKRQTNQSPSHYLKELEASHSARELSNHQE